MWRNWNPLNCLWECKMVQPVWTNLSVPQKVKPYGLAIPLLAIYPREMRTYAHIKTDIQMCLSTLFIIAKKRKQPKCPSTDEWINKIWHSHTMEYYSII